MIPALGSPEPCKWFSDLPVKTPYSYERYIPSTLGGWKSVCYWGCLFLVSLLYKLKWFKHTDARFARMHYDAMLQSPYPLIFTMMWRSRHRAFRFVYVLCCWCRTCSCLHCFEDSKCDTWDIECLYNMTWGSRCNVCVSQIMLQAERVGRDVKTKGLHGKGCTGRVGLHNRLKVLMVSIYCWCCYLINTWFTFVLQELRLYNLLAPLPESHNNSRLTKLMGRPLPVGLDSQTACLLYIKKAIEQYNLLIPYQCWSYSEVVGIATTMAK